jgi:hypothetical protein
MTLVVRSDSSNLVGLGISTELAFGVVWPCSVQWKGDLSMVEVEVGGEVEMDITMCRGGR